MTFSIDDDDADLDAACLANADAELERRMAAARPKTRSEKAAELAGIAVAVNEEARLRLSPGTADLDLHRAGFEKWRLIHRLVRETPYRDRMNAKRSEQWREALEHLRPLKDDEFIDWLSLQIEVARNLETGIQDMRPRKGGPSWLVALEYVANRKRKALALLHWAEEAADKGFFTVDSDWHARSRSILGRELDGFGRGAGGHEGIPWPDADDH